MWNPLHKNDQHITAEIAKYGISHHHLRATQQKKTGCSSNEKSHHPVIKHGIQWKIPQDLQLIFPQQTFLVGGFKHFLFSMSCMG